MIFFSLWLNGFSLKKSFASAEYIPSFISESFAKIVASGQQIRNLSVNIVLFPFLPAVNLAHSRSFSK